MATKNNSLENNQKNADTPKHPSTFSHSLSFFLPFFFVVLTSFFTYVVRYNEPSAPFWDEPYHIASAQKYLHGVYFMEQHPPLGKLFIALGEKIIHQNKKTDQFLTTDYARDFGENSSFAGYRLFPTLFAWGSALLLFFIFVLLTQNPTLSALFSFLYIFDTAQIVHNRGAMLEPTLSFFALLTILSFLLLFLQRKKSSLIQHSILSALFGISFACALTTKVVSLVLILLVPILLLALFPFWRKMLSFFLGGGIAFFLIYSSVWYVHFSLGSRIVSELPDQGYYQASDQYKTILANHETGNLRNFPIMLRDSLKFIAHYNNGVPRLDLCKADENGSPAYFWPFGGRTINYRWAKNDAGTAISYLYLAPNPVGWGLGFLGVIFSFFILLSSVFGERKSPIIHLLPLLTILSLYSGYMIAISTLDRVMYLYHYFLPLLFSYVLFALSFINIHQFFEWKLNEDRRIMIMTILGLCIFASFQFFRPLSYYIPMTNEEVQRRSFLSLWELHCVDCKKKSTLVVPSK
jgi:dolichyl-phosphate-mannose--protein O-mannosyl transferase